MKLILQKPGLDLAKVPDRTFVWLSFVLFCFVCVVVFFCVVWLVGRSVGWSVGWSVGRSGGWSIGRWLVVGLCHHGLAATSPRRARGACAKPQGRERGRSSRDRGAIDSFAPSSLFPFVTSPHHLSPTPPPRDHLATHGDTRDVPQVAILVGGPDWPTSVLCGIMRLPLLPILVGALTPPSPGSAARPPRGGYARRGARAKSLYTASRRASKSPVAARERVPLTPRTRISTTPRLPLNAPPRHAARLAADHPDRARRHVHPALGPLRVGHRARDHLLAPRLHRPGSVRRLSRLSRVSLPRRARGARAVGRAACCSSRARAEAILVSSSLSSSSSLSFLAFAFAFACCGGDWSTALRRHKYHAIVSLLPRLARARRRLPPPPPPLNSRARSSSPASTSIRRSRATST